VSASVIERVKDFYDELPAREKKHLDDALEALKDPLVAKAVEHLADDVLQRIVARFALGLDPQDEPSADPVEAIKQASDEAWLAYATRQAAYSLIWKALGKAGRLAAKALLGGLVLHYPRPAGAAAQTHVV